MHHVENGICSANGIEIECAGESLHSHLRCYLVLASLNGSLSANKVRDNCRGRRVETNHVKHAAVVRIGESEAVGGPGSIHLRFPLCQREVISRTCRRAPIAANLDSMCFAFIG